MVVFVSVVPLSHTRSMGMAEEGQARVRILACSRSSGFPGSSQKQRGQRECVATGLDRETQTLKHDPTARFALR